MKIETLMVRIALLLLVAMHGGIAYGASFDCQKAGLSKTENTICADESLSELDSQLDSVFAVAKVTATPDAKGALLKAQSGWLAKRNQCASVDCLRSAYEARIEQLSSAPGVRDIDFDLGADMSGDGRTQICPEFQRAFKVTTGFHDHIAAKDLPKAFAKFVPFVPSDAAVLDLVCADIKGDGSTMYLLVARKSGGFAGTLTILSVGKDGLAKLEAQNATIIQTDVAGVEGGYQGIIVNPKGFAVVNGMGGGGDANTYKFTFAYSAPEQTWMLTNIDINVFGDDNTTEPEHHTAADLGKVTFSAFDAAPYGIDTP